MYEIGRSNEVGSTMNSALILNARVLPMIMRHV